MRERFDKLHATFTQKKEEFLTPPPKKPLFLIIKATRYTLLGSAALTALIGTGDYISHALGYEGLSQSLRWRTISPNNCTYYVLGVTRQVLPGEVAMVHIETKVNNKTTSHQAIDISGEPLSLMAGTICFDQEELASAEIIFQAQNGPVMGEEQIYALGE
jgi:hypothetical protein